MDQTSSNIHVMRNDSGRWAKYIRLPVLFFLDHQIIKTIRIDAQLCLCWQWSILSNVVQSPQDSVPQTKPPGMNC